MGVYVYTIKGGVKNLVLTPEAMKSMPFQTHNGVHAEFYSRWVDEGIPWSDEDRAKCRRLDIDSLTTFNHGRGKALITRLEKRELSGVEFAIFGDYGDGIHHMHFRHGQVSFFDTPNYTTQGQIGTIKKVKGKYHACPRFCLFLDIDNKWKKGLVEDFIVEKDKVTSYIIKTGKFETGQLYVSNHRNVEVRPEDVDFQYGFTSYHDNEWNLSEAEINKEKLNRKLKKIKA